MDSNLELYHWLYIPKLAQISSKWQWTWSTRKGRNLDQKMFGFPFLSLRSMCLLWWHLSLILRLEAFPCSSELPEITTPTVCLYYQVDLHGSIGNTSIAISLIDHDIWKTGSQNAFYGLNMRHTFRWPSHPYSRSARNWKPRFPYRKSLSIIALGLLGSRDWWQTTTGTLLKSFDGHFKAIHSLVFTPDDACLATGGEDSLIHLWALSRYF